MTPRPKYALAAALALLAGLAGCAGAPERVLPNPSLQCHADRGIGGTGLVAEERGMGGTGLVADRGIGGTGIIGTVTGFGSICVNGFEVAYGQSTPVRMNGIAGTADQLARGVTVAVTATTANGQLQASSIEILHALVGPVTAVPDADGTFAVMGLAIEGTHATGIAAASLAVGDLIAIDGLQQANGVIDATYIARAARDAEASIRGVVSRTGATVRIGTLAVAASETLPADGTWAAVAGTWSNGVLAAARVTAGLELASNGRISVEGFLFTQSDGRTAIRGMPLREDAGRGLGREVLGRLAVGQRVQVLGERQRDGSLRPETVIVPDRLSPLGTDVSTDSTATTPATTTTTTRAATTATRAAAQTETLQTQRGVYGETVTRPAAVQEATPVVRPAVVRPAAVRPEAVVRPERPPARPEVRPEVRPDVVRPTPSRPGR